MSEPQEDTKDVKESPSIVVNLHRAPRPEGQNPEEVMRNIVQRDRARAQWIASRIQEATAAAKQGNVVQDEAQEPSKMDGAVSEEKPPEQPS